MSNLTSIIRVQLDRITELEAQLEAAKNQWIPVSERLPESSIRLNLVIVAYFVNGVEHQGSQKIRLAHYYKQTTAPAWLPQKADEQEIESTDWKVTKWLSVPYDTANDAAIAEVKV